MTPSHLIRTALRPRSEVVERRLTAIRFVLLAICLAANPGVKGVIASTREAVGLHAGMSQVIFALAAILVLALFLRDLLIFQGGKRQGQAALGRRTPLHRLQNW